MDVGCPLEVGSIYVLRRSGLPLFYEHFKSSPGDEPGLVTDYLSALHTFSVSVLRGDLKTFEYHGGLVSFYSIGENIYVIFLNQLREFHSLLELGANKANLEVWLKGMAEFLSGDLPKLLGHTVTTINDSIFVSTIRLFEEIAPEDPSDVSNLLESSTPQLAVMANKRRVRPRCHQRLMSRIQVLASDLVHPFSDFLRLACETHPMPNVLSGELAIPDNRHLVARALMESLEVGEITLLRIHRPHTVKPPKKKKQLSKSVKETSRL